MHVTRIEKIGFSLKSGLF